MSRTDPDKVSKFVKAFQGLWVSGMAGTFFFFTWRSVAQDVLGTRYQFAATAALDRAIRYSFLLWLFGYFFVAQVESDEPNAPRGPRDILFDVLQSIAAVAAALCLGFVIELPPNPWAAHFGASIAVSITGGLSLLLFGFTKKGGVGWLRVIALAVGICMIGLLLWQAAVVPGPPLKGTLQLMAVGQVVLWIVLFRYVWVHIIPDT